MPRKIPTTKALDLPYDARYSKAEAAALLGEHPRTITRYTDKGWLKAYAHKYMHGRFYTGRNLMEFWHAYTRYV